MRKVLLSALLTDEEVKVREMESLTKAKERGGA